MIDQKDSPPELDEAGVSGSARLAAVHVRYGELRLPSRVAEALADSATVEIMVYRAHGVRGSDHVVNLTATRDGAKLRGFTWPEETTAGSVVKVACNRHASVVLVVLPTAGEITRRLAADEAGASTVEAEFVEPVSPADAVTEVLAALADFEQTEVFAPVAAPPTVAELEGLEVVEVEARPRRGIARLWFWLVALVGLLVDEVALTIRLSARWEQDHSRTIARLVVAVLAALVLAGAGIGALVL